MSFLEKEDSKKKNACMGGLGTGGKRVGIFGRKEIFFKEGARSNPLEVTSTFWKKTIVRLGGENAIGRSCGQGKGLNCFRGEGEK